MSEAFRKRFDQLSARIAPLYIKQTRLEQCLLDPKISHQNWVKFRIELDQVEEEIRQIELNLSRAPIIMALLNKEEEEDSSDK